MDKVTVSSKGQIAIPKQVRDALNLAEGTKLTLEVRGQEIVLSKGADWKKLQGAGRPRPDGEVRCLQRSRSANLKTRVLDSWAILEWIKRQTARHRCSRAAPRRVRGGHGATLHQRHQCRRGVLLPSQATQREALGMVARVGHEPCLQPSKCRQPMRSGMRLS